MLAFLYHFTPFNECTLFSLSGAIIAIFTPCFCKGRHYVCLFWALGTPGLGAIDNGLCIASVSPLMTQ